MDGNERRFPYIWVTWITGLVSGDKQCWWASWFKAHYQDYQTLDDPNANRLTLWKAEHAQLVAETADAIKVLGYQVRLEDQNKLNVKGETAIVGAKPDIVATPKDGVFPQRMPTVTDCKTGKPRDSDFWQVAAYVSLLTLKGAKLEGQEVAGSVIYRGKSPRQILPSESRAAAPALWAAVRRIGGPVEPARVPSPMECRDCHIACCPDRAAEPVQDDAIETGEF